MKYNTDKISLQLDSMILLFLTVQVSVVSISIAISSISFGIWLGLWLIQIILDKKILNEKQKLPELKLINIFILLYFLFEIISRFFAIYPEGAFNNLKRLLLFSIFYVSIIKILNFRTLAWILFTVICSVSLISCYEIIKYIISFKEMISATTFSEIRINYFNYPLTGGEIKMMLLLSVFPLLFVKESFIVKKKYFIVLLIPVFVAMILTQSRNVFLALLICFIVYGLVANKKFLVAFIIFIIAAWLLLPPEYTDRFKSIGDLNHPSNKSRISMWEVGWKMFKDHPFTGIADSHILEIYKTYKIPEEGSEGVHLHNNFMMILVTTGVFGFIAYMGFFILMFIKQIKFYINGKNKNDKLLIMGSLLVMLSFHISGIFEWSFGDHEVMTVFFFLIAIPFIINNLNKDKIIN